MPRSSSPIQLELKDLPKERLREILTRKRDSAHPRFCDAH